MASYLRANPEMREILRRSADMNQAVSGPARYEIAQAIQEAFRIKFENTFARNKSVEGPQNAKALELPLRPGVLRGDIISNIFEMDIYEDGVRPEYPIDFLSPSNIDEFVAYTIPNAGRIPEKTIEGDYIMVPTYQVGASIDWNIKYAEQARWDIVSRGMEVLEGMVVRKLNNDGWHVILTAGFDRNITVTDANAAAGNFTKRLVSQMKTSMRRNGGGNSASTNRYKLTDLFVSPEAMEDIRNWGVDQIDEVTRREIYIADDGGFSRIFGVNLHDLDELGANQEYQAYWQNTLGGTFTGGDLELVIGLDLSRSLSFLMPVEREWETLEDPQYLRQLKQSFFGWMRLGFASLSNAVILQGTF